MKAIDFRYNQRIPESSNKWQRKGKFAHELLHQLGLMFRKNPPPFDTPTESAILEVSNRMAQTFDATFMEIEEATDLIIARREKLTFTNAIDFEKWIYIDHGDGNVTGGIIDRIDQLPNGRIHIWDYKTGSSIPSRREMAEDPQTLLYLTAAAEMFPFSPVSIVFWYMQRENGLFRFDWTEETSTQAHEKAGAYIAKIEAATETDDWPASVGRHCRTCGFRDKCPAAKSLAV